MAASSHSLGSIRKTAICESPAELGSWAVTYRSSMPGARVCQPEFVPATSPGKSPSKRKTPRPLCRLSRVSGHRPRITFFSVIVRHARHVVRWFGVPPQRHHLRVIRGDKITDGDSHGSVAQQLPGGIVVRGGNFQHVAFRKFVTAL